MGHALGPLRYKKKIPRSRPYTYYYITYARRVMRFPSLVFNGVWRTRKSRENPYTYKYIQIYIYIYTYIEQLQPNPERLYLCHWAAGERAWYFIYLLCAVTAVGCSRAAAAAAATILFARDDRVLVIIYMRRYCALLAVLMV